MISSQEGAVNYEAGARSTAPGHLGVPEDAAGIVFFLASDVSSYVPTVTTVIYGGGLMTPPPLFPA